MAMRAILLLVASLALAGGAAAGGYKESVSGDLSNVRGTPTAVTLTTGSNIISGQFGVRQTPDGLVTDRDYFKITVPAGKTLSAIGLGTGTSVGASSSFIGIQRGPKVTVPPDTTSPAKLLGWTHFTTSDEGSNILPEIGAGPGAIGFVPPLGPGTYSFWVQETSICTCRYQFDFRLTAAEGAGLE